MKVEHITYNGNSILRDTKDIFPETIKFFEPLQINEGAITIDIEHTKMNVKVTVENCIAVFDMRIGEIPLTINLCCFDKNDREPVMLYARDVVHHIYGENKLLNQPSNDRFLYSITIPSTVAISIPDQLETAGEIEFYIYNALRS